ncbi:MAG: zinc-ribbon and DUF3426 domain-containing protein [Comamonas sp.]
MSQITRCPQCQTRFKVVDDQLRISDGWVRCGKCKAVFDALAHLVPGAAVPAPDQTQPAPALAPRQAAAALASAFAAVPAAKTEAAAVLMTQNSLQIDPNAQVPELSVLVFPRRANLGGDSGYVDSSWMQAYEDEAAAALPLEPPAVAADRSGLESQWQPLADQRPPSLRSSRVDFSATDDLAELQAREGRLLEAMAERQKPAEPVQQAQLPAHATPLASSDAGLPLAPSSPSSRLPDRADPPMEDAPRGEAVCAAAADVAPKAQMAATAPEAQSREDEALLRDPALAGHTLGAGKVEPTLAAPTNYVAQMDEAVAAVDTAAVDAAASAAIDAAAEPGFVRAAKRKAFWRKPWVVVLSLLLSLLLLAALLLQVALTQRDRLALAQPQWRPALQAACRMAGCEIAVPRQLQAVSIDSTSFNAVGPRQFRLRVVLRNAADDPVAVPSLELSLNDAAEKLVLRRVLGPQDLQAPAALDAHGEWTAEMVIEVAEAAGDVVGYRVLAFYP